MFVISPKKKSGHILSLVGIYNLSYKKGSLPPQKTHIHKVKIILQSSKLHLHTEETNDPLEPNSQLFPFGILRTQEQTLLLPDCFWAQWGQSRELAQSYVQAGQAGQEPGLRNASQTSSWPDFSLEQIFTYAGVFWACRGLEQQIPFPLLLGQWEVQLGLWVILMSVISCQTVLSCIWAKSN